MKKEFNNGNIIIKNNNIIKDNIIKNNSKNNNRRNYKDPSKYSGDIICPCCGGVRINKTGRQNSNQRYLCRDCGKTFTLGEDRRKKHTEEFKLEVIKWYLENVGIRSLERRLHISNTTIIRWIKEFGKIIKNKIKDNIDKLPDDLKELKDKKEIEILEGDEIVTFIKKNLKMEEKMYGYGYLQIGTKTKLLILR